MSQTQSADYVSFNEIEVPMPTGWEDHSLISLRGTLPHTTGSGEPDKTLSIVLSKQAVPAGFDLEEFATEQETVMQEMAAEVEVLDRDTITVEPSDRQVSIREYRITVGNDEPVQQMQAYFLSAGRVYIVTGTSETGNAFEAIRAQMLQMLGGLRVRRHARNNGIPTSLPGTQPKNKFGSR